MMAGFYVGCGVSLVGAAFAPTLYVLAVALFALGMFAAIYHPVGTAMMVENATHRGRTLAFNGVCGNLGVSLAAGITATLTAAFSWRGAFLVPGVVCIPPASSICGSCPNEKRPRAGAPQVAPTCAVAGAGGGDFRRCSSWLRSAPGLSSTPSRCRCPRSSTSVSAPAYRWSRSAG